MNPKWLWIPLILLLFLGPVSADEEVTVEYVIGQTYWHGKGELIADNLSQEFTLHKNGNTIVSYSTDAKVVNVSDDSIEFRSDTGYNKLHVLFLTPKPGGHGLWDIRFMPPNVTGEPDVKLKIEGAERIVYLNGPVWLEGQNIYEEGDFKVVELKDQNEIELKYLTERAYNFALGALITFSVVLIVLLATLGVILRKREEIKQKIKDLGKNDLLFLSGLCLVIFFLIIRNPYYSSITNTIILWMGVSSIIISLAPDYLGSEVLKKQKDTAYIRYLIEIVTKIEENIIKVSRTAGAVLIILAAFLVLIGSTFYEVAVGFSYGAFARYLLETKYYDLNSKDQDI